MSNIVYRQAEPDDAEAVYIFGRQLLSETSLMLLYPDERAKSVDDMRFVIQRFQEMPRHFLINAWDGEFCVGEALCMGGQFERNKHAGRVGVGILSSHYGQGVGKGLVRAIERIAEANGIVRLDLTAMEHNERAHRLYLSLGYKDEGMNRRSLFVDGAWVNEIMMSKLLDEEA